MRAHLTNRYGHTCGNIRYRQFNLSARMFPNMREQKRKSTKELKYCKEVFNFLGREDFIRLLEKSNLTDRNKELIEMRFVHGKSIKECSDHLNIEENSVSKSQRKICRQLYKWLVERGKSPI